MTALQDRATVTCCSCQEREQRITDRDRIIADLIFERDALVEALQNKGKQRPRSPDRRDLSPSRLRQLLTYDRDTGIFRWRFGRQGIAAGTVAGYRSKKGHIRISIDGWCYLAHHLAWLWEYREWPPGELDHRNGNPSDNSIDNLRPATNSQNQANSKRPRNNTSGFKGVNWRKRDRRWYARIRKDGRDYHIGSYATIEEARAAYEARAVELFGEFARAA